MVINVLYDSWTGSSYSRHELLVSYVSHIGNLPYLHFESEHKDIFLPPFNLLQSIWCPGM